MRVRKIETDRMMQAVVRERRLPARSVNETNGLRRASQISPKHIAENSTRGNKAIPIAIEDKSLSSDPFIVCKLAFKTPQGCRVHLERGTPDVDFVIRQFRGFDRSYPLNIRAHARLDRTSKIRNLSSFSGFLKSSTMGPKRLGTAVLL